MESKKAGFVALGKNNLRGVARELAHGNGRILIAEPGPNSFKDEVVDIYLSLFAKPLIDARELYLYTNRKSRKINGINWQTSWQDDRKYFLRLAPEPSGDLLWNFCRDLGSRLLIGPYEFSIGFQEDSGRSILTAGEVVLYIPKNQNLRPAFVYGLTYFLKKIKMDRGLLVAAAGEIVDYVMNDLKTSSVFRKNVSAGMEADMILG